MLSTRIRNAALCGLALVMVAACGQTRTEVPDIGGDSQVKTGPPRSYNPAGQSIFDLFKGGQDAKVNRHLWTASLEVLNFLPVEAADPFTGVISTGYGTPPGGGPAYRATILISDPALDARSLNVALQTRSGPVAAGTQRAVEDAILDRARQLRISSGRF